MIKSTNSEARLPVSNPGHPPGGLTIYLSAQPQFPHGHESSAYSSVLNGCCEVG